MNNSAVRFFFGIIGTLLFLSFVVNKWINKELAPTVKAGTVFSDKKPEPQSQPAPVEPYDTSSDYPSYPTGKRDDIVPVVEKPKRVFDKKIIYEMPTSNKFLLQ